MDPAAPRRLMGVTASGGVIMCIACGSAIHEKEDCPYRDAARDMWRQGIEITSKQLREIDDAARNHPNGRP